VPKDLNAALREHVTARRLSGSPDAAFDALLAKTPRGTR